MTLVLVLFCSRSHQSHFPDANRASSRIILGFVHIKLDLWRNELTDVIYLVQLFEEEQKSQLDLFLQSLSPFARA